MSGARHRPRIDLSFGPGHGPVSGVVNASGAALGLTMWLWLAGTTAIWALIAGVGLAAAAGGTAAWYDQRGRVVAYRTMCWIATGLWSFWVLARFDGWYLLGHWHVLEAFASPSSPWTWRAVVPLLVGTMLLAAVGWAMWMAERKEERDREKLEAQRAARQLELQQAERVKREPMNESEAIGDRWEPVLQEVTRKKIRIANVEIWDPAYGFTLDCQLPHDGTVLGDIKHWEEALSAAAPENLDGDGNPQGLPDGCGVEIMPNPGMGKRNFLIKVTTVSALGDDIPYPDDLSYETVENPIPLGVETDRTIATIPVRYETTVLVGNTDSGKSNQLNVITAGFARCTDVLLVGIDLSGNGRMMRPWIREYAEGRATRPTFHMVAPDPERALLLCASLINIINGRTADYADLLNANDWDKIMVSPELPQIVLVVDEGKTLPDKVKEMIETIVETGRGAAVRVVFCALEAVAAAIPKPIIKHSRNRIGMRVVDETELVYLFDSTWRRGRFDPASLPWKGSGLYANGPTLPTKFKGYRIDPARVRQISTVTADYRPALDHLSLLRGDTVTLTIPTDMGPEEVTFDHVWTDWEGATYPDIFPNTTLAPGRGQPASEAGKAMAMNMKEKTVTNNLNPRSNPAATVQEGFAGIQKAQNELNDIMRELNDVAESGSGGLTREELEAAAAEQEATDNHPVSPAVAGAAELTAEEFAAMFDNPVEPVRPRDNHTPAAPFTTPGDRYELPENPVHAGGRPSIPPKKRILQIIAARNTTGGILPGDLRDHLASEGYTINITTVQNTLRDYLTREYVKQIDGARTPYVPGPKFPADRI